MPRTWGIDIEPNRLAEMATFARVIETGGFSGAARALGMSPSAVSKVISRLETRLGARLLRRSTRRLALTSEGEAFLAWTLTILADLEAAEREAGGAALPAGRICLNTSSSYLTHVLAKTLPKFLTHFPDIAIDIVQSDAVADLVAGRSDIAVRAGPLKVSNLRARSLGSTALVIAAAPSWIEHHGLPGSIDELARHDRLGFAYPRAQGEWLSPSADRPARVRVSDGEGIRRLALAGIGPARLAHFTISDDLAVGRLVRIAETLLPEVREEFHVVYLGRAEQLPSRVRVLLDHLQDQGRVD